MQKQVIFHSLGDVFIKISCFEKKKKKLLNLNKSFVEFYVLQNFITECVNKAGFDILITDRAKFEIKCKYLQDNNKKKTTCVHVLFHILKSNSLNFNIYK